MRSWLFPWVLVGGLVLLVPANLAAQEATPIGTPAGLAACPIINFDRVIAVLDQLAATPAAAGGATPTLAASSLPTSPTAQPADDEVVSAVTETVELFVACVNAGYQFRPLALFSDGYIRREFGPVFNGLDPETVAEFKGAVRSEETEPLPAEQRTVVESIGDVQVLDDGRVVATVVGDDLSEPGGPSPIYFIFVEADGEYLIDEVIDPSPDQATPAG